MSLVHIGVAAGEDALALGEVVAAEVVAGELVAVDAGALGVPDPVVEPVQPASAAPATTMATASA